MKVRLILDIITTPYYAFLAFIYILIGLVLQLFKPVENRQIVDCICSGCGREWVDSVENWHECFLCESTKIKTLNQREDYVRYGDKVR